MVSAANFRVGELPAGGCALTELIKKWWCYLCRKEVDREHITMVLSHERKTGRCDYKLESEK